MMQHMTPLQLAETQKTKASLEEQVAKLKADLAKAAQQSKPVPLVDWKILLSPNLQTASPAPAPTQALSTAAVNMEYWMLSDYIY